MIHRLKRTSRCEPTRAPSGPVLSSVLIAVLVLVASPGFPCDDTTAAGIRFLVGDWIVVDGEGREIARSNIERFAKCGLRETWRGDDANGVSIIGWDAAAGQWSYTGYSSENRLVSYRATSPENGAFELTGTHTLADGRVLEARSGYRARSDGSIEHRLDLSDDGGSLSTVFEGAYVPAGTAPSPTSSSTTSSSSERATTATTTSSQHSVDAPVAEAPRVRAESPAEPRARAEPVRVETLSREADVSERSTIEMASPMVLRLPLGPVEKLPEGYAWSSREVAPYVVDGVSILRLRASQKRKRGQLQLAVDLDITGRAFSQQIDLTVRLYAADGTELGTAELNGETVGRSLTEQIQDGWVRKSLQLSVDSDEFQQAVSSGARPELEISVDVR